MGSSADGDDSYKYSRSGLYHRANAGDVDFALPEKKGIGGAKHA